MVIKLQHIVHLDAKAMLRKSLFYLGFSQQVPVSRIVTAYVHCCTLAEVQRQPPSLRPCHYSIHISLQIVVLLVRGHWAEDFAIISKQKGVASFYYIRQVIDM